ncbi:MAG TPA: hypothetical protein VH595_07375 [Verrucomicrobiae bacterium]|jgi:regulator of RNase E activity RraA|nr:hypothetical protein [Verrucomicrobiae bacterium]
MKPALSPLTADQLEALRRLDACTLANVIETFHERLRNEGYVDHSVRAIFPRLEPMVGFAATIRILGSELPTDRGIFPDRTDLWDYIVSLPMPRVLVIQDCAERLGMGSFLGVVHANIVKALGCVGAVTNGSVRDIPALESLALPVFAGSICVSHAYIHIVEMGKPVEIGGLKIKSGDLLHGDVHGVQSVPIDMAGKVPDEAKKIAHRGVLHGVRVWSAERRGESGSGAGRSSASGDSDGTNGCGGSKVGSDSSYYGPQNDRRRFAIRGATAGRHRRGVSKNPRIVCERTGHAVASRRRRA